MKLISLKVENLINNKHFTFMQFVLAALGQFTLLEALFGLQISTFRSAFEKEDEVHMKHNRSFLTPAVQEAEDERDKRFRYVHDAIKLATQDFDAAKAADALFLMGIVKDYGGIGIARMPVDAESGALTNLASDLLEKYAEKLAALSLTAAVERMQAANDEYIRLSAERTLDESQVDKEAMADARRKTDIAYRGLVDTINLHVQYHGDGELLPFIKYLNAEIERYRIQIGQGVSTTKPKPDDGTNGGAAGGGATAVMKNATFKFIGGRTEIIPVEVGTVLIPPTNTEGYKWKPTVPELMPKTNKTFSEVPIDDREVTLTFHFLEHNDETLRGIVGSALTAPLNTDGCHWEPTVPPTFPEEDMTFNEVLDEPAGGSGDYSIAKFIFQSGESEEIRQLAGSVLHAPQNTEGCRWIPEVPATMPAVNTTYNEVAEGEPLYTIAWYDKSTPIAWYELPEGAAVPDAPEPPAGCRWAQTFTVMPARDVDIVAVAI